jgi:hypothetical protein
VLPRRHRDIQAPQKNFISSGALILRHFFLHSFKSLRERGSAEHACRSVPDDLKHFSVHCSWLFEDRGCFDDTRKITLTGNYSRVKSP